MKKFPKKHWTRLGCIGTLCASFLSPVVFAASNDDELRFRLQEAETARQAAELRCMELNAALIRTRDQLQRSRKEFADCYLDAKELREKLNHINQRAASIMHNGDDLPPSRTLSQFVDDLPEFHDAYHSIYRSLVLFRQQLNSTIELLAGDSSDTYSEHLGAQLDVVFEQLSRAERFFAIPLDDNIEQDVDNARVLAVNRDLQVVVVSVGRRHGVRPGLILEVADGGSSGSTIRILETFDTVSAAAVLTGKLRRMAPGAKVRIRSQKP